ncbi:MAG: hypothetical protein J5918_07085 [Prevotella sp.]|nr:hypothetical protein [Prevotella sp.]
MKRSIITMALAAAMLLSASVESNAQGWFDKFAKNKSRILSMTHSGNTLYIGTCSYGLVAKDLQSGTEQHYQTTDNYPVSMYYGNKTLYVGSLISGMSELKGGEMRYTDNLPTDDGITAVEYATINNVDLQFISDSKRIYIKAAGSGAWQECQNQSIFNAIWIGSIVTDKNGLTWIGSNEGSIGVEDYSLKRLLPAYPAMSPVINPEDCLHGVNGMCKGNDEILFIASDKGLYSYDYHRFACCYGESACYDVQQSDDGTVWAVTKDALLKYDGESVTSYPTTSFESEGNVCLEVAGGAVYVGGMTSGVYKFENGEFTKLEYEVANGIDEVSSSSAIASPKVYSSDGKELDGLAKGLNIVKSADGKTVKVIR